MRMIGAIALMFSAIPLLSAQEPLEFKGVRIGSTARDLQALYPAARCTDAREMAAKEREPFKSTWESIYLRADVLCVNGTPHLREQGRDLGDVVGHRVKSIEFAYIGNKLMHGSALLPPLAFTAVVDALIERYGQPTERTKSVAQNRFGAKFDNETVSWRRDGVEIRVTRYSTDLSTSSYTIESDDYSSLVAERRRERAKNATKAL